MCTWIRSELASEDAADARAGRQADDAVAPECPFGDDLGHRLPGDGQPAELQIQEKVIRHGLRIRPEIPPGRLLV
jgi:hypothetical protein